MPLRRLTSVRTLCAIAVAMGASAIGAGSEVDARRARTSACPQADIQSIQLGQPAHIDAIRVVVARRSPIGGAALVRVDAGDTDRVVYVRGGISKVLHFTPAITAAELEVSVDPVLSAPRGACIERVELLSNGQPVAAVKPE